MVIDHGNGEFSFFGHLQKGSVQVKEGERVRKGQMIGRIGFSGDAFIPHLHYMLMDGPDFLKAEGLPSYFHDFQRINGSTSSAVSAGQIDSGDILEASR